jgi:predicted TIM-barrel fold metal-dependent hydrolase
MEGVKMVPKTNDWPIPIDPQIMETWGTRLRDFEEWRLPGMDAHEVTVQVLSLTAPGIQAVPDAPTATANAKKANDYLAAVIAKHPDRFVGFAALPLQDPKAAVQELNRCVRELGFCGALVNDHTLGHYLDEPQFSAVWQALTDLHVPLYIHPGAPPLDQWNVLNGYPELTAASWAWQAQVGGHALRLIHGRVFDRFPTAKVILGHMGEFLPFQLWRFDSRYKTLKKARPRTFTFGILWPKYLYYDQRSVFASGTRRGRNGHWRGLHPLCDRLSVRVNRRGCLISELRAAEQDSSRKDRRPQRGATATTSAFIQ